MYKVSGGYVRTNERDWENKKEAGKAEKKALRSCA